MNNEFLEFLRSRENVPLELSEGVRDYVSIALHPKRFLLKFYLAHLAGGVLTLAICPQFGLGIGSHSALFHYIYNFGALWCGIFCAGVFWIGAGLFSSLVIGAAGRDWISERSISVVTPFVSFLFFFGMLINDSTPTMHHGTMTFYVSWFFTAIVLSLFFSRFGRNLFRK